MATFVNEDGLYDVILDSRKPSARAFRKWVTSEVLPQIRRTGGYLPTRNPYTGERLSDEEGNRDEIYEVIIKKEGRGVGM